MQNQLKNLLPMLLGIAISTTTFANQPSTVNYSPYADLMINTRGTEPMNLPAISQLTGINSYHLAFITDAGNCNAAWGSEPRYSINNNWASHLTDELRANLINYIISFGGARGNDISMACSESQLIVTLEQVLKIYQPQGLDFDIENGSANVVKLMHALKQVQNVHPNLKLSFTLAVSPEGLTEAGQEVIQQAKANQLDYSVNIMAMDYGQSYVNDMGQYAIQAATNLFAFLKGLYPTKSDAALWQMVEVTPMIGVNDVNVEQFTLKNVDTLRNFAQQNKLRSLSMWSITRDNPCSDRRASSICSGNNLQSKPYEFSQRFMQ